MAMSILSEVELKELLLLNIEQAKSGKDTLAYDKVRWIAKI